MDIISHGLWGSLAVGRQSKSKFWLAFSFGVLPDLFSFGIFTVLTLLGIVNSPDWTTGPPPIESIPAYINTLYNITHSFIIFLIIFILVSLIIKKPLWVMLAWPLHIFLDIFTHSSDFFPTPFLWPISNYSFNGIAWSHPFIFFTNWGLLAITAIYFIIKKNKTKNDT